MKRSPIPSSAFPFSVPRSHAILSATLVLLLPCSALSSGLPGDVDPSFQPKSHGSNHHLVEISTGKLMATSDWISKSETFSLVRMNADGSTDPSFACKNVGYPEDAFAERPDGGMLFTADADRKTEAGGKIICVNLNIAGADGASGKFTDEISSSFASSCLMGQSDGSTLIAGRFQFFGPRRILRNRIARLATDGSVDESFDARLEGLGVYSFAVQTDGKIVIGGRIESVGGRGRNCVARLLPDGAIDSDFHPGWTEKRPFKRGKAPENTGANGTVFCVVLQPDGKILLGGNFTGVAGVRRNLLARLHPDGQLDESFNPMIGGGIKQPAPAIHSLALQTDGKIVIGGNFTHVKGIGRNNLARLLPSGDLDPLFYPCPAGKRFKNNKEKAPEDTGIKGRVCSLSLQKDGKVLVGGYLFGVGGLPDGGMARLMNEPATSEVRRAETGGLVWLRGGSSPEIEQVVLEQREGESWKIVSPLTRMAGGWKAAKAPAGGQLRLRGTGRGGQNCGSTFFVVEEVPSVVASDSR